MPASIPNNEARSLIAYFGDASFTTLEFIDLLKERYPITWSEIEAEYGAGGKGAGKHYSAFSRVSQVLNRFAKQGEIVKNDYERAPAGYGSPVIRRWNDKSDPKGPIFTTDVDDDHWEGAVTQVLVNKYERDPLARHKCVQHYGPTCQACDFDFEAQYGELGAGFIHVHHRIPISSIKTEYKVDPIKDLVPVCPNCHAMLHRKASDVMTVEELRSIIK
jgi:hypothetical protein